MQNFKAIAVIFTTLICVSAPSAAKSEPKSPVQIVLEEMNRSSSSTASLKKDVSGTTLRNTRYTADVPANISSHKSLNLEGKNTQTPEGIDLLQLKIEKNVSQYKSVRDKLVAAYGAPKSQRGGVEIWEIETANAGLEQSKMTTIMTGQESGDYFVTIDRRGNSRRTLPPAKAVPTPSASAIRPPVMTLQRPKIDFSVRD